MNHGMGFYRYLFRYLFLLLVISFIREDDNMKSVIPFSKELDFSGKLSEITSISLEREFEVVQDVIDGNLFVTGDYKSHEISANVIPFSFKIPFSINPKDSTFSRTQVVRIPASTFPLRTEEITSGV